ncbi:MAG: transaldolase family protein [Planctomycetota bacterium]
MAALTAQSDEARKIQTFVKTGFTPHFNELQKQFASHPRWRRMKELGTELWLDTGDPEEIEALWTREFSALTTNNTLLNKEVQKGTYDNLIPRAREMLNGLGVLSPKEIRLELAFILNARHALSLVEHFDGYVSVEEHTDLANDLDAAVTYARRYHAICPERFIVKLPFTPAGVLATRQLAAEGVPVNHTLGFSARQNYLITHIGQPRFCNVFLGRLNSFVADNKLGDGAYVGERATIASQQVVRALCERHGLKTRQIGASLRSGEQVRDLAGLDVLTMPAKAAAPFRDMAIDQDRIVDSTSRDYQPGLKPEVDPEAVRLSTLWDVPENFIQTIEDLAQQDLDGLSPSDLVEHIANGGFPDFFPHWTMEQVQTSRQEGKIPDLKNWREILEEGRTGLDALMNLAAFNSFVADQEQMDNRVASID